MTSLHKLSLPTSINTSDDSFSRDLIRQFDKRRSRLHFELGLTSQVNFQGEGAKSWLEYY